MTDNKNVSGRQQDDSLQLKDLVQIYLSKWKWFVLSLAVCLGVAVLYLLKTPSVYTRSSSLLIEEDSKGQSIASEMNFSDLGLFQSNTNVNNEIIALSSPATMQEDTLWDIPACECRVYRPSGQRLGQHDGPYPRQ